MEDIKVLDVIIAFIKAMKDTPSQYYFDDGTNRLWGAKYLLGQILRQYRIKDDHIFVSQKAHDLWIKITNEDMGKYNYTMGVPVKAETTLELYKGAAKTPFYKDVFKQGDKFQYRQVFHDEHIIPIADIIEKLIELENLNYENVQKILDNIYVCRMLKSENIELNKGNRNKREWDVEETVEKIYKETHGIEIVGWKK